MFFHFNPIPLIQTNANLRGQSVHYSKNIKAPDKNLSLTKKVQIHFVYFLFLHIKKCVVVLMLEANHQGISDEYHNICFCG